MAAGPGDAQQQRGCSRASPAPHATPERTHLRRAPPPPNRTARPSCQTARAAGPKRRCGAAWPQASGSASSRRAPPQLLPPRWLLCGPPRSGRLRAAAARAMEKGRHHQQAPPAAAARPSCVCWAHMRRYDIRPAAPGSARPLVERAYALRRNALASRHEGGQCRGALPAACPAAARMQPRQRSSSAAVAAAHPA
jgi:hypothetical protein